jgi:hypothetical protein
MDKSKFVILNGFDRCGSSAISKTISNHPDIELIMQPFNSGFIRKSMYQAIEKSQYISDAKSFFNKLANNELDNKNIHSHWHKNHSSTQEFIPGRLHLVKTTINHFAQRWMNQNYPNIDVWGIWRDPFTIINSIKKNDFQDDWYADALEKLRPTVIQEKELNSKFGVFFKESLSQDQELALIFAVRSYFFFYHLPADRLIIYESFRSGANKALKAFSDCYELREINFNTFSKTDLNIIGKSFNPSDKNELSQEIKSSISPILSPLIELYKNKFQHD